MKKSVLLFVGLLLTAVNAIAQPAKPTVTYTDWVEEKDVYLYNVEAGLFLTGGNDWGSRATMIAGGGHNNIISFDKFLAGSGSVQGEKWKFTAGEENRLPNQGGDVYSYRISRVSNAEHFIGVTGVNTCWVDAGPTRPEKDVDGWYIIKKNADKTFQLGYIKKKAKTDEAGNEVKEGDQVVYEYTAEKGAFGAYKFEEYDPDTYIDESEAYSTWACVDATEYDRVVPLLRIYWAGQGLKKTIEGAEALGIDADLSEYKTTLNKADVTLEELQNAIKKLSPVVEFGKVIVAAKEADPVRDWSKYEAIYADPNSTNTDFETNTKLINAFLALKKAVDEAKELDAAKAYAQADAIYADDESALADIEAETKRVNAFISLKKVLNEATEKGYNVADYTAVYNNVDATAEALAEAEEKAKNVITSGDIAATVKDASAANPADLSQYIVNATFDKVGDFTGWSKGFGAGGDTSTCAEVWRNAFDVYQDIKGLPEGVYMVACNGYSRHNDNHNDDYVQWKSGAVSDTKIYMKSETHGQYFTPVMFVSQGGSVDQQIGTKAQTEYVYEEEGTKHTLYCPNSMAAANDYFHDGTNRYRNEAYGPLAAGEALRIGVSNTNKMYWSIFDDFQLFYLGNGADAYQKWAESVRDNYNVSFDGEVYYGAPEKAYYEGLAAALSNASDKDAVSAAILKMDLAVDSVATSKKNYAEYVAALVNAHKWLEENVGDDDNFYKLSDYMEAENAEDVAAWEFPNGPAKVIIPDYGVGGFEGILSAEAIAEETTYLKNLLAEATRSTLADGSDLTSLINNPGFEEADGKGWKLDSSKGGTTSLTNWHGGNADNYCAEAYQQNFDIYQEIEGVKDGLYEVSVQAFYRTAHNKAAYEAYLNDPEMKGDAKVYPEVYINEFSSKIRNVMEIQFADKELDEKNTNTYHPDDTEIYTLDGMTSASNAFSLENPARNFTMSAYGVVQNGKIRIGLRKLEGPTNAGQWTLWDNFKLTYRAKNPEVAAKVLASKSEELAELLETESDNMTDPVLKSTQEAYEESKKTNLNDAAKYEVLIETNDALVAAKENIEKVTAYKAAIEAYNTAGDELNKKDPANQNEVWDEVDDMDEELAGDAFANLSTEELAELIAKIDKTTEDINAAIDDIKIAEKIAEMADASDDKPYDATSWIVNPDMEDHPNNTMTGWDFWKAKGNGPVKADGGITGASLEAWSGTVGADLEFTAYQTITKLPAGKYTLSAKAANASNGVASDETLWADPEQAATGRAYLCAILTNGENETAVSTPVEPNVGSATEAQTYSVTFTLTGGEDVKIGFQTIGTMPFRWFMCDDFTLMYYGTASAKADSTDAGNVVVIEGVEEAAPAAKAVVAIYNAAGAQINALQSGINIVKYSDGTTKKIFKQ